jgi:hypothetical protein
MTAASAVSHAARAAPDPPPPMAPSSSPPMGLKSAQRPVTGSIRS